ncbi:hypothetical protein BJ912DRAFT_1143597 [Pholiota molesta]|nr:hypothetical protein BJ912DRAFT_1143597 [Pholiota molesta]
MDRCPVFCIADIPTTTLDLLLECTQEYLDEPTPSAHVSERVVIMHTKDIATITKGSSPPITSSPTAFLGLSLEEVRDWFAANITEPCAERFMSHCFLVLDNESIEDESCIFVATQYSAPGEIHALRCDFDVAYQSALICDVQEISIEEGVTGSFMRSGVTMTKENLELALHGGLCIADGEVKVDEEWRDFSDL